MVITHSMLDAHVQDHYSSIAGAIVTNHCNDQQMQSRLVESFNELTPQSLKLDLSKQSRTQFRKNLEQFLPHVKGFLYYR